MFNKKPNLKKQSKEESTEYIKVEKKKSLFEDLKALTKKIIDFLNKI